MESFARISQLPGVTLKATYSEVQSWIQCFPSPVTSSDVFCLARALILDSDLSLHGPMVSLPLASETPHLLPFSLLLFFPCHLVQGRSLLTLFSGSCCHGEENSTIPQLIESIRARRIFLPSLRDFHFIAMALKEHWQACRSKTLS